MQPTDYIAMLVQVPIVGIFVWFSLQMLSKFLDALEQRDLAWREFIKQQAESNQDFLKQQSEVSTAAIQAMTTRFADEIRNLGKEVAEFRGSTSKRNRNA